MSDSAPQKSQQEDQNLAALGIDGGSDPETGHDVGYTLDDFLPLLLTLLTPRKALTNVPTFTPKTFADCIQLYTDGTNFFLYVFMNDSWHTFPASPVSKIIGSDGIGVSPGSGIGAVTVLNLGVKTVLPGTNITVTNDGDGHYTVNATAPLAASYKATIATHAGAAASGTYLYAHGFGKKPAYVRVTAVLGAGTPWLLQSFGTYDGTNTNTLVTWTLATSAGGGDHSITDIVNISTHGGDTQSAIVSGLDATNLSLDWTKAGSLGALTIHLLIECFG
jgi:hypothetical protein